jgi:DNA (cytosine-5)-methyltransferase 1
MAWHHLGWTPAFFSEIDAFPSAVLEHHHPDVPNLGDMTAFKEWPDYDLDLLVGGTPCQSFSVAGLRKGLRDPRGNLALTFLAIADRYRPQWVVWENVPGVLSSHGGRDFGSFLGALAELGYGWSYRVLDAQFFGVPQRRRRVFVVGHLGDCRRAAAVLFEPESLRGDSPPSREAGEDAAANAGVCTARMRGFGDYECDGTAGALKARDYKDATDLIAPVAFHAEAQADQLPTEGGRDTSISDPLTTSQRAAAAFQPRYARNGQGAPDTIAAPLMAQAGETGKGDSAQCAASPGMAVRRLTPRECERLQGFPDDFTQIPYRNKPANQCPDGPRYKALGNSMAVPVMRWLGERIHQQHRQDLASQSPEWLGDMNLQIIKDVYGEKPMIEEQLKELVGATRAANDLLFEIKQVLVGLGASPTTETPAADSQPTSPAPIPASEAAAASAAAPPSPAAADPADSEAGPTKADVMAALRELDKAKGKSAVQGVLAQFKARNLTSLDAEKYAAVIEAAQDEAA